MLHACNPQPELKHMSSKSQRSIDTFNRSHQTQNPKYQNRQLVARYTLNVPGVNLDSLKREVLWFLGEAVSSGFFLGV